MAENGPIIVAHRGNSSLAPENTLAAFERAITDGASWIEMDVRFTADSRIAIIHDPTVNRTTNGEGRVCEMTLAELKELDSGSWFDPRFSTEKIPTLEEAVEKIEGRSRINFEIKEPPEDVTAERIVNILREHEVLDQGLISSFSIEALLTIRQFAPHAALGLIGRGGDILKTTIQNKLAWFLPHFRTVNVNMINQAHEAGIGVNVWTIDEAAEFDRWAKAGADMITTNKPHLFLQKKNDEKKPRIKSNEP
jgi:glycerophosphoryl diester phosphodiesterase